MPTQKNTDNSRKVILTAKCNFNAIQYGNDHGRIAFGKVHKKADVTSSVMLEAKMVAINSLWIMMGRERGGQP